MDNLDQLKLKQMLIDIQAKQERLQATIQQLKNEIEKREILIDQLESEKELELAKDTKDKFSSKPHSKEYIEQTQNQRVDGFDQLFDLGDFSSEFTNQVALYLDNITKTTEEISASIRL